MPDAWFQRGHVKRHLDDRTPTVFLIEDGTGSRSRRILSVGSDPDQFDETGDGGMYAR